MALYIVLKSGHEYQWHVGQSKPLNSIFGKDNLRIIEDVAYIQADGDELEYIKDKYIYNSDWKDVPKTQTLPIPNERVVQWVGDMAKMITLNL